jgi:hypothetical protein
MFIVGVMMILLLSFIGYFKMMAHTLKNDYARAFGKLAFPVGLVTPIVVNMILCSLENSIYLTGPVSTIFAIGHMLSNILTGLTLYLVLEYPLRTTLAMVFGRSLFYHRELLSKHYNLQTEGQEVDVKFA